MRGYPTSGYRSGASSYAPGFRGGGGGGARAGAAAATAFRVPPGAWGLPFRVPPRIPAPPALALPILAAMLAWMLYRRYNPAENPDTEWYKRSGFNPAALNLLCGNYASMIVPQSIDCALLGNDNIFTLNSDIGTYGSFLGEPYASAVTMVKPDPATPDVASRVKYEGGLSGWSGQSVEYPAAPVDIPEVPLIPYKDIPRRDAWAGVLDPATSRGNDIPAITGVDTLAPEAYAHNPGNTYVIPAVPGVPVQTIPGSLLPPTVTGPPPKNTRQKKARVITPVTGPVTALGVRIFSMATEACDAVDAAWNAIPFEKKLKDKVVKRLPRNAELSVKKFNPNQKWSSPGCVNKGKYVFQNVDAIDVPTFVKNLVINELIDRFIGKASKATNDRYAAVERTLGRKVGKGVTLGPAL